MVSEDYLGLNDQLVLAVSHSKLLKSHLSFKYKCVDRIQNWLTKLVEWNTEY